jgi:hypothetical protein
VSLKQALLQASGAVLLSVFLPEALGGAGEAAPASPEGGKLGAKTFVIRQRIGADVRDLYAETHRNMDRLLLDHVLEYRVGICIRPPCCWGSPGKPCA